jgi:hypothetical protein
VKRALVIAVALLAPVWLIRDPAVAVVDLLLVAVLVLAFRRYGWLRWPRPGWYPCEQCGRPIERPSRARFCSTGCRSLHRLQQRAPWNERAAAQLELRARTVLAPPVVDDDVPF